MDNWIQKILCTIVRRKSLRLNISFLLSLIPGKKGSWQVVTVPIGRKQKRTTYPLPPIVSFADKIKSKTEKETSSRFLSFHFSLFLTFFLSSLLSLLLYPLSVQFGPFLLQTNTRLIQCPLCNEGFNPFLLILL
jgi:hypothetical protein